MRVLVTNDNGVFAPGLAALAPAVESERHEVVVAAPSGECSGAGAALGPLHLTGRIAYSPETLAGLEHVPVRAVDGPPALAVLSACLGGFGPPPDAVVSGINAGANTGRAVLHSGTVGAALTAANFGCPAMAVRLALGSPAYWETAATTAAAVLPWLRHLKPPSVLNVNVPNPPRDEVCGVQAAPLADAGTVQASVIEESDSETLELTLPSPRPVSLGTDSHARQEDRPRGPRVAQQRGLVRPLPHAVEPRQKETPVEPRQDIEVRCRFDGTWVGGFQVAESTEVGGEERYRLLRLSDGVVLPGLFALHDLRPRAPRDRVLPMSRRQAPAPVGAGGS